MDMLLRTLIDGLKNSQVMTLLIGPSNKTNLQKNLFLAINLKKRLVNF